MIIIEHVLNKKYDQLLFFTLKLLFESELYSTFQVIYIKDIVFLFIFCLTPIKGFNTSTNFRENTMISYNVIDLNLSFPIVLHKG